MTFDIHEHKIHQVELKDFDIKEILIKRFAARIIIDKTYNVENIIRELSSLKIGSEAIDKKLNTLIIDSHDRTSLKLVIEFIRSFNLLLNRTEIHQ